MSILLLDNRDSYTFNLFQQIARLSGIEATVVHNDALSWDELEALAPRAIVLSPGPGRADRSSDFGVCSEVLTYARCPVLGVCLGMHGLGQVHGAEIGPAPSPVHGRLSTIRHSGTGLFRGLPQDFRAVRYHSLALSGRLPAELEALAWADDGVLMALRHRHKPHWGVQFHPEAACTEHGDRLIENFLRMSDLPCRADGPRASTAVARPNPGGRGPQEAPPVPASDPGPRDGGLHTRRLELLPDAGVAFEALFSEHPWAFWLDSSLVVRDRSRFSYLGAGEGVLRYRLEERRLEIHGPAGMEERSQSIFDHLADSLAANRSNDPGLPLEFHGGYVGYFGYEMKAECGAKPNHRSPHPDAAWIQAERFVVLDHQLGHTWLVGRRGPQRGRDEIETWFDEIEARLRGLSPTACSALNGVPRHDFVPRRSLKRYRSDIAACKRYIHAGESYELCLTNQLIGPAPRRPLDAYKVLRRTNPAPWAAYLRVAELHILCSSPELFLSIDGAGRVTSRPIKGTRPRHSDPQRDAAARADLAASPKDRAENMMIVDLVRNDLGRVCEVGSVEVLELMGVESYATVHQLVSTVEGQLRQGASAVDCIRAAFPGGSMTGAPKLRTMELLDGLEGHARGIYSGAIGHLSFNGACQLGMVIRTAVVDPDGSSIGVGGAVIWDSQIDEELAEMQLKGRALVDALARVPRRA
jgi:para-aminobenzoate synthetase